MCHTRRVAPSPQVVYNGRELNVARNRKSVVWLRGRKSADVNAVWSHAFSIIMAAAANRKEHLFNIRVCHTMAYLLAWMRQLPGRNGTACMSAISLLQLIVLAYAFKMYLFLFKIVHYDAVVFKWGSWRQPDASIFWKYLARSFRHASPHLWSQLPTSLRIPHPNYSSPSQRPSFEHTGLTCYTLLSPSITFSLFHSEFKTYLFRKSYPPP